MNIEVEKYYDSLVIQEWNRFNTPFPRFEFESTKMLIKKYFPKKGLVCDIGCGPGRYAIELLKLGYKVTLVDISKKSLEFCQKQLNKLGLKAEDYIHKNALNLDGLNRECYDAILLLGPMHHLIERAERKKVLENTRSVLKKNGIAIIAYLNSWGLLKAGISEFPEQLNRNKFLDQFLNEVSSRIGMASFTKAHFTLPEIAISEVESVGFKVISYAGCESFAGGMSKLINEIKEKHPQSYNKILKLVVKTCEYKQFRDTTEHLHLVAEKN